MRRPAAGLPGGGVGDNVSRQMGTTLLRAKNIGGFLGKKSRFLLPTCRESFGRIFSKDATKRLAAARSFWNFCGHMSKIPDSYSRLSGTDLSRIHPSNSVSVCREWDESDDDKARQAAASRHAIAVGTPSASRCHLAANPPCELCP